MKFPFGIGQIHFQGLLLLVFREGKTCHKILVNFSPIRCMVGWYIYRPWDYIFYGGCVGISDSQKKIKLRFTEGG